MLSKDHKACSWKASKSQIKLSWKPNNITRQKQDTFDAWIKKILDLKQGIQKLDSFEAMIKMSQRSIICLINDWESQIGFIYMTGLDFFEKKLCYV